MVEQGMVDVILERAGQNLLPGYIFKFLWAPLARDYLIGHVVILDLVRLRTYPQHTLPLLPLLRSRPGGVHKAIVVRSPKSDNSLKHCQLPIANCRLEFEEQST